MLHWPQSSPRCENSPVPRVQPDHTKPVQRTRSFTGPLAGKQFVLHRNPTVIGSSPKADIYLFKDEAIEPSHALIHNRGGRFEIEDQNTPDGTYVNSIPVKRQILKSGDQIVIGKMLLEFSIKESA